MTVKLEIDCTPEEARAFLGLPNTMALNAHLVEQFKSRIDANISLSSPEYLMKEWLAFGGLASDYFRKLMGGAGVYVPA